MPHCQVRCEYKSPGDDVWVSLASPSDFENLLEEHEAGRQTVRMRLLVVKEDATADEKGLIWLWESKTMAERQQERRERCRAGWQLPPLLYHIS
jgi:hypothetical protein